MQSIFSDPRLASLRRSCRCPWHFPPPLGAKDVHSPPAVHPSPAGADDGCSCDRRLLYLGSRQSNFGGQRNLALAVPIEPHALRMACIRPQADESPGDLTRTKVALGEASTTSKACI